MIGIETQASAAFAAERAAALIADRVRDAVGASGRAAIALSGGTTPKPMLERLGRLDLPWPRVHVFQVDERIVPRGSPERNLEGLLRALAPSGIGSDRIHAMPVDEDDGADAARAYADTLLAVLGPRGALDVVHLGLGADGHTASLFPGDPAVDSAADVTVTGPHGGTRRLTLSLGVLNRARFRLWLVTGAGKRAVLERFLGGDAALTASRVRRDDGVVVADAAANPHASA